MDIHSRLVKLKLEMIYKDLAIGKAREEFGKIVEEVKIPEPEHPITIKAKRKVVKALLPKSKV
jgi:hypothetical protein